MGDLKSQRVIITKGFLFLFTGILSFGILLLRHPTVQDAALLAACVWSFCRFYYFAFYVIQHYVDDDYRFSGLADYAAYSLKVQRNRRVRNNVSDAESDARQAPPN